MSRRTSSPPPPPPRKRRRPAVVCAECRRRKIACDRKSPCGQCALHEVECVYVTGSSAPAYGRPLRPRGALNSERASAAGDGTGFASHGNAAVTEGGPAVSRTTIDNDGAAGPGSGRRDAMATTVGRLAKARLFGRSHWMNNLDEFKDVHSLTHLVYLVSSSIIYQSVRTCKRIARIIKTDEMQRIARVPTRADGTDDEHAWLQELPRAVADRLVDYYFDVFEPQFRILHLPTFRREYAAFMDGTDSATATAMETSRGGTGACNAPMSTRDLFLIKLVLVLALGSCFYEKKNVDDPTGAAALRDTLRTAATRAVTQHKHSMDAVFGTPLNKHRLGVDALQVFCLVAVARQTTALAVGDDMGWFTTGGLLHTACGMGLHCDPAQYRSLTFAQAEMRRRLWATILELVVQASLDQGMPPLISSDDYDVAPPHNLNDGVFDFGGESDVDPHPHHHPDAEFTQSTMQRLLYRSLPTRLKIAKALNAPGARLTYDRALQLSQELLEACRYAAPTLRSAPLHSSLGGSGSGGGHQPVPEAERAAFAKLRVAYYEMLTRRFHHSLHSPFARKAGRDVQYYFSRRARVETVLRLLSFFRPSSSSSSSASQPPVPTDPCRQLWLMGRGLLECTMVDMAATAVNDLIHQLQEEENGYEYYVAGASDLTLSQRELYDTVRTIIDLAHARIAAGETNVKGYLFFRGALAQVDALMTGTPVRPTIMAAAQVASEQAIRTLRGVAARRGVVLPENIEEEEGKDGDKDKDKGKGKGKDDANDKNETEAQKDAAADKGPPATVAPTALQTDKPGAADVPLLGAEGNVDISTPSQVLGMVDMVGMAGTAGTTGTDGLAADADSGIHLSSAAGTDMSSGTGSMDADMGAAGQEGWVDEWILDPQSDFGLDNWFFPYNDRLDG